MDDLRQLLFAEALGSKRRINLRSFENLARVGGPDAVDKAQGNINALFARDIDTDDSWHRTRLTLTLFVAHIGADHPDDAFAPDDAAMLAQPSH
jgi:hypothetical protein